MIIIRYMLKTILRFLLGMLSFFAVFLVIGLVFCLLLVGLTCAMFTCWSVIHLVIYLSGRDPQAEARGIESILMAAGCFGVIIVFWSVVGDLWRWITRPAKPLSLSLNTDPAHVWHWDYTA